MNRKLIFTIAGISALACNFLFPVSVTPPVQTQEAESVQEEATQPPVENESDSSLPTIPEEGFILRFLHPKDGDLQTILKNESQKASALGLTPIAYFGADWCPPCRAIEAALEEKNELMLEAYRGTYIIELDVDEWGWDNGRVGDFTFDFIPVYFKLDADGNQTGEVIDGGAWGEDIPENIAPVMDKFFHGDS